MALRRENGARCRIATADFPPPGDRLRQKSAVAVRQPQAENRGLLAGRGRDLLHRGVEVAAAAGGDLAVEQGGDRTVQKAGQAGDETPGIGNQSAAVTAGGRVPLQGRAGAAATTEAELADGAGFGGAADAASVAGLAPARFCRRAGVKGDQLLHVVASVSGGPSDE